METDDYELIFQKWGNEYRSLLSLNESYIVCEHLLCVYLGLHSSLELWQPFCVKMAHKKHEEIMQTNKTNKSNIRAN